MSFRTVDTPFLPNRGENQVLAVTSVSATATIDAGANAVRVVNAGPNTAFFRLGQGAPTASSADTPVLPGNELIVRKSPGDNKFAYNGEADTTIHVQPGKLVS